MRYQRPKIMVAGPAGYPYGYYVTSPFSVTPLQGIEAAAGPGTTVQYVQGLPTDTSLSPIPNADLTPAYQSTNYGQSYTGTLTAPATGTYVLAFRNPGSYTATNLSVTLATVSAGIGNGITALHIFAMAIGSGTPTGG